MATADIIRKVQRNFGDDDEIFLTKADIVDYINEALDELARVIRYNEVDDGGNNASSYTTTGVANNAAISINRVTYDERPLALIDKESLDRLRATPELAKTHPVSYYIIGNTVHLYPRPTATDTKQVVVYYSQAFTHLVNDASALPTNIIPVWENDIVNYCKAKAHERNENYRAATYYQAEWEKGLAQRSYEGLSRDDSFYVVGPDIMDVDEVTYLSDLGW